MSNRHAEALREYARGWSTGVADTIREAADEIDRLEERLEAACDDVAAADDGLIGAARALGLLHPNLTTGDDVIAAINRLVDERDDAVSDLDDLLLHDVRYALGRLTWVPGECAERVRRLWARVSPARRVIIRRDIAEHVERFGEPGASGGDPWGDRNQIRVVWRPLLAWIDAQDGDQ